MSSTGADTEARQHANPTDDTRACVGDPLGEQLIAAGFVPSAYVLDLNHSLMVPYGMALPAPWNLPSRLFQFPIEVSEPDKDGLRRLGLMHPLLGDHLLARRVAAALGIEPDPQGAPNAYGVSKQRTARWWHAVDLISAGLWRALLETRRFTTDDDIAGAVTYGLDYSPHNGDQRGYIGTGRGACDHAGDRDRRTQGPGHDPVGLGRPMCLHAREGTGPLAG